MQLTSFATAAFTFPPHLHQRMANSVVTHRERPAAAAPLARIPYLDGWRGISIALVLMGHFAPVVVGMAGLGVQMFFALSGRLMSEILFVQQAPIGEFYRRRLARIYPALLVFVLVAWIAFRGTAVAIDSPSMVGALSFTLNYRMAFGHGAPAIENLWSLCIEEHAYLLLGAAALALRGRRLDPVWLLLAIAGVSLADGAVSILVFHLQGAGAYWRTDTQLAPIFLSAAAFLALRDRPVPGWTPLVALGLAFASTFAPIQVAYAIMPASLAVAVATIDRAPAKLLGLLSSQPLATVGLCSYSIYLWQHPFYGLALRGKLPPGLALALGLAAGVVSFRFVEQPARRWLNRVWTAGRPGASPRPLPSQAPAKP